MACMGTEHNLACTKQCLASSDHMVIKAAVILKLYLQCNGHVVNRVLPCRSGLDDHRMISPVAFSRIACILVHKKICFGAVL